MLRAKAGVFIANEAHDARAYFAPAPANVAHAEEFAEGQETAQGWQADLQAVIRPRRWIDGVGILACCGTMGARACSRS
eukprot:2207039-Alexandrium_andersonii.AAC.1